MLALRSFQRLQYQNYARAEAIEPPTSQVRFNETMVDNTRIHN